MLKHTPGPWLIVDRTVYALTEDGVRNRFFAAVQDAFTGHEELEANARLIAAAPELLEALQRAAESAGFQYMVHKTREVISAAIAKATGGAA